VHSSITSLALLAFIASFAGTARATTVVEALGDARITRDEAAGAWTVSAGGASLTLVSDAGRDFQITGLTGPSGRNWLTAAGAGTVVTVNGAVLAFGNRGAGFEYESTTTSQDGHVVRLDTQFLLRAPGVRVTRHIAATSGSPSFELWTTFESTGAAVVLADLNAAALTIAPGTVRWTDGLQGEKADSAPDAAFTLRQQTLASGQVLTLGSQGRSSEQTVPVFTVDGVDEQFYTSLLWSGAWSLAAERSASGLTLSLSLGSMHTTLATAAIEGPHTVVGVVSRAASTVAAALRAYAVNGLRGGRDIAPLVTYNTWYSYGTEIDDASVRAEMERAAALGVELFVVDAGWYPGAGVAGQGDFDAGLGSWQIDPARFPDGLAPLSAYAHALGMKFGIWVEPERVNLSTVGPNGASQAWLATAGGSYQSTDAAQICLAGAAGRRWVVDHLTAFIDAVQPDYLKWDNNLWVNCDRAGHGHGADDGNFAHVTALYEILAALRERYPSLLIENVSGGGNRLDLGMLRYTDAAWMDDRTAPSAHVRHNLQGLAAVFPTAYLLSFVTDDTSEGLHDAVDLPLYFRSRMAGVLGLCFRGDGFSEADLAGIAREIEIYKSVRDTQPAASGSLLTAQAAIADSPEWDALQTTSGADAVLYAVQSPDGSDRTVVKPIGLQPGVTYRVVSVDTGLLGQATGADLMAQGVELLASPNTAAHMLTFVPQP
jgi:alpha-galactosidase